MFQKINIYDAISKLEKVRSDKGLLKKLNIKKPKLFIVQLKDYLVDKAKNKDVERGLKLRCSSGSH